jgi:hypothetical protein
MRKLRSAYSGSAIRVRRSSDDTEQDIGFSGEDLDTSALETFCSATDGYIVTWYDQSGNTNDLTQSTAANQAQIVSSGSTLTGSNSKPAATFDGSNDGYQAAFTLVNPITRQSVISLDTFQGSDDVFDGYNGGTARLRMHNSNSSLLALVNGRAFNVTAPSYATWVIIREMHSDTTNEDYQINATTEETGNAGNDSDPGGVTVGCQSNFTDHTAMKLSEVIAWPSDLGGTAEGTARDNANTYYSVY